MTGRCSRWAAKHSWVSSRYPRASPLTLTLTLVLALAVTLTPTLIIALVLIFIFTLTGNPTHILTLSYFCSHSYLYSLFLFCFYDCNSCCVVLCCGPVRRTKRICWTSYSALTAWTLEPLQEHMDCSGRLSASPCDCLPLLWAHSLYHSLLRTILFKFTINHFTCLICSFLFHSHMSSSWIYSCLPLILLPSLSLILPPHNYSSLSPSLFLSLSPSYLIQKGIRTHHISFTHLNIC